MLRILVDLDFQTFVHNLFKKKYLSAFRMRKKYLSAFRLKYVTKICVSHKICYGVLQFVCEKYLNGGVS